MLQRIQSVWLLLASLCAFLTLKFSVYYGILGNDTDHYLNGTESLLIIAVTLTVGIIGLINIFLYQNRKLQLRLCILAIAAELALLYLYYQRITVFTKGTYSLSSLLHIGVIVFFILAARGIGKDEKLIKDSNRLR